ncbi:hypothetical protein RJ639_003592 [Escallonia herrerae]|uniref:Uncharacterized protein n=1 Tax=Escallonia herrerae TaxID=1293975 RepID=A0AA88W941_9ASTE|nr:hypothetical protein RJ639_003592 [Escallonia herrerae]
MSMDNQRNLLFGWPNCFQVKSMEELAQSLLLTAMELDTTKVRAQEELKVRDEQLVQLKDLINKAIRERDEAQDKCQKLMFEKLLLQQQVQQQQQQQVLVQQQQQQVLVQQQYHQQQNAPHSGISSIEDEPRRGLDSNNGFSSSDCEESIVSSPVMDPIPAPLLSPTPPQLPPPEQEVIIPVVPKKPLPEKGKLLQAVMQAGPLLQTLLLAGPLPQWRHPPPPLDTYQIPPPPLVLTSPLPPAAQLFQQDCLLGNINNCGRFSRKRGLSEGSDSSTETKYQRIGLN